ncbi:LysE family translocator [Thalassovita sp.]|uniref:LysE family translocator n=1 Tax=Thalassovita sp. TaxID=1979401 RepID=UPI0029DE6ACB|nr:LysE family translocator [Thalassovita sp.]
MTLAAFLSIIAIHLAAAMSPGPSFVVAVRVAASDGFRPATGLAIGFGLGAALWAAAALGGLALLFQLVPGLFIALKLVGAAFLLWIGWQMWRHAAAPLPLNRGDAPPISFGAALRLGFLTFATNPKPAVFYGAVFAGLVPAGTSLPWLALIVATVCLNETLWYLFVARAFSLPRARSGYIRLKTWIDRLFGGVIALFGLKIAIG